MAVHLSRLAKHFIADFVNHREVIGLNGDWHGIYQVFSSGGVQRHRMPPPVYATTKELDLCLRKDLSDEALQHLFTEGPEATFWYKMPTGLISRLVEIFLQKSTETALRPIFCVCDYSTPGPTLLWQELYINFFPCPHCQRMQLFEERLPGRERPVHFHDPTSPELLRHHNAVQWRASMQEHLRHKPTYVIEVFHVKNTSSGQAITIELWFDSLSMSFVERLGVFPTNGRIQSPPLRRQLPAELMLEAYRFLDRYSLDASQLVSDEWRGTFERSSEQLALYALSVDFKHFDCERESERMGGQFYGIILDHEWEVNVVNYSTCFGWVNARDFHFLNAQTPEHSSAAIRRHLRNAFVKQMSCDVMTRDFDWIVGMLLGLSESTIVKTLDVLFMREECLSLFGRFEAGLIRRRVQELDVTVLDPLMKALIDAHSFFGRPSIQQLKRLELRIQHLNAPLEPYWLPALYELTECRHLAIHYQSELLAHDAVDVTRIHAALDTMLQEFETNSRDIAVEHFWLTSVGIPSLVNDRKQAYESIPVHHISIIDSQRWNVYHFETADKKKCLTLFVPPEDGRQWTSGHMDVHLKRGKIMDFT